MISQRVLILIGLMAFIASGCGPQSVSFKKSGDENAADVIPPDDGTDPCVGCDDPGSQTANGSDIFFQTPRNNMVDILFIDDNSGSMEEEQRLLGQRFSSFISGLSTLDWQIGITTTDVSNGKYGLKGKILELAGRPGEKILKATTPNADTVFANTIQRPETLSCSTGTFDDCPSGVEQPLYASILAMEKRNSDNRGFFRDGADLAIVILSDEDEMSNGPSSATKPKDVVDKFKSLWGREKRFSVFGIIIEPGDQTCLDEQVNQSGNTGYFGIFAHTLTRMTGGVTGSICERDYSSTLENIGEKVLELSNSFELAHTPINGSVRVTLTPAQNTPWSVRGNKLMFNQAPQPNTRIDVTYQYNK